MKESASALATANNSMEESAAMITAITEITQDSQGAGNSLRTLSMRLRGAKSDLESYSEETDGVIESTSKLQSKIKALTGVDIMLSPTEFKSTYQIMSEVSKVWNDMTDINRASFLEIAAGKTRANQVASLLNNWSQAERALDNALNSAGTAAKENAVYLDSIQGRTNQLKASFQSLSSDVINSELVKWVISLGDGIVRVTDGFLTLSSVVENILPSDNWDKYFDMFKALPSLIAAISAAVSIKKKGEASGVLGSKMPFARAIEHMHKPENCWKSLTPAYQIGA